jgi:nucleoside 2-deoxyribosyltransferase
VVQPAKKLIYIAAPFFTPAQVTLVETVESSIKAVGMAFYSPRLDGVLKDMLPEERKAKSGEVFKRNCAMIMECNAMIAVLDEKDTGTTWECGFAYYHKRYYIAGYKIIAYTSEQKELNVMLAKCFDAHAQGAIELLDMITAYRDNMSLTAPASTDKIY